ncbi:MAG: transglycosylase SLT domain-containing protein [Acidobacteria bacterium]|nr:transglycosylase SLT domain-containing protein [Acidobacteriota bacterium]
MAFKKLFLFGATCLALGILSTSSFAQDSLNITLSKPSNNLQTVNSIDTKVTINPEVQKIVNLAEQQYRLGESLIAAKQYEQARTAFDRAIDIMLEASSDVHKDQRFRSFYLELVDRVHKHQLIACQSGSDAINYQLYEPSPLDELSKIDLDAEGVSTLGSNIDIKGFDFEFTSHSAVNQFINFFTQGKGRNTMEIGLRRSGKYRAMAERIFKEEGVPLDIVWLAQVESVWTPQALSSAAAKGIWQFIPSTGERYGLRQNALMDERISPEKATRAAARYLKFLNNFFAGDWLLAMGAYNCGENGMDRAIGRCGYADFWEVYERNLLPQETRNYVPAILAVITIAKDPTKYGFNVEPDNALSYDSIELSAALDLRVASSLINVPCETLRELNPELKRGVTPSEGFTLKIPKGTLSEFETAFSQLLPENYLRPGLSTDEDQMASGYKTRYVKHSVNRGGRYKVKNASVKRAYAKRAYVKASKQKTTYRSHSRRR